LQTLISEKDLLIFTRSLLLKVGLDEYSTDMVATCLIETSLRGVDSHGIRLLPHYVKSALSGRKNTNPNFKVTRKFPTIALLDADNAYGHAAGMKAIDVAINMAEEFGMGCVGVANSSHPGAMGSFAIKAARQGYIAFAFTHADSLLVSHGGKRPYFGTNPFCMAAPREGMEPFCLDMATSSFSWNTLLVRKSNGENLPENVAVDENGEPTIDPILARALYPIGGYKGYGIAAVIEILCSIFTGMNFGRSIPSMYKAPMEEPRKLGQFYMVIKADGCVPLDGFMKNLSQMTEEVRDEPAKLNDQVMLAGDKEINCLKQRRKTGIPVDQATLTSLMELSREYELPFNSFEDVK